MNNLSVSILENENTKEKNIMSKIDNTMNLIEKMKLKYNKSTIPIEQL
jgi:hypothetical protein